jgi:hypothetical protein
MSVSESNYEWGQFVSIDEDYDSIDMSVNKKKIYENEYDDDKQDYHYQNTYNDINDCSIIRKNIPCVLVNKKIIINVNIRMKYLSLVIASSFVTYTILYSASMFN